MTDKFEVRRMDAGGPSPIDWLAFDSWNPELDPVRPFGRIFVTAPFPTRQKGLAEETHE